MVHDDVMLVEPLHAYDVVGASLTTMRILVHDDVDGALAHDVGDLASWSYSINKPMV